MDRPLQPAAGDRSGAAGTVRSSVLIGVEPVAHPDGVHQDMRYVSGHKSDSCLEIAMRCVLARCSPGAPLLACVWPAIARCKRRRKAPSGREQPADWPVFRGNALQTGVADGQAAGQAGAAVDVSRPRTASRAPRPWSAASSMSARWTNTSTPSTSTPASRSGSTRPARSRRPRRCTTAWSTSATRDGMFHCVDAANGKKVLDLRDRRRDHLRSQLRRRPGPVRLLRRDPLLPDRATAR